MKLMDLKLKNDNFKDLIKKAIVSLNIHAVVIFGVDQTNGQIFELSSSENGCGDTLLKNCIRLYKILEREKKALLIDAEFTYQNEVYQKAKESDLMEIYVPVLKDYLNLKKIIGIVYFEYSQDSDAAEPGSAEMNEIISEFNVLINTKYDLARKKVEAYHLAYMLCEIVDMKEPYIIGRLFNVANWCERISKEMGLPEEDIDKLHIATLMHDLGKIYISDDILNKKGNLTDQEYEMIKKRVVFSYEIAESFKELTGLYDLPDIILNYQERIDGKGYPNGKKGDEIPLLSKILGAAKAITSMLTNTSYSPAKTIPQVIEELEVHSDTQFDNAVAEAAVSVLAREGKYCEECLIGIGSFATLNIKILNNGHDENLNLWGNIKRNDSIFVFTPTVKLYLSEKIVIQGCSLYISYNDQIIHYIPKIKSIDEDKIEFSHLDLDKESNGFSINWMLQGLFVTPSRSVYDIFVTTIGGDHIDFTVFSKNISEEISEGVVKLTFDDGIKVALPGIVTSKDKIDERVLFRFKYIGIKHEDMKLVYSQLFRKQIAVHTILRRMVK